MTQLSNSSHWQILQVLAEGVLGVDHSGQVTFMNKAGLTMLGFDSEHEVIGKGVYELTHRPANYASSNGTPNEVPGCAIINALESHQPIEDQDEFFWRADGTILPVCINAAPIFNEQGQVEDLIVAFQDRSSRHAIKQELILQKEALQLERRLFIGGPTVIFQWQMVPGWPITYVSPNVFSVLGYKPQDLIGGAVIYPQLVHPDDFERVSQEVEYHRSIGSEYFEHKPYRLLHADGSYRWFYDFTVIERRQTGSDYHSGYLVDITKHKETELALARSEHRYRLAQSVARFGIWEWDVETQSVYWDAETLRLLGYDAQEGILMDYSEFISRVHPDDRQALEDAVKSVFANPQQDSYTLQVRGQRPDGGWQWIESLGKVVEFSQTGNPKLFMGTVKSITKD
ncbi:PAS domain-containing protein [Halorhodospira halochloris]|uniref:PAS domain-containing protein n=1 Tax=Halorhodospira halochloris TaxID=1052 RepID=UPI001EE909F6|nr:PAS domain-containing protein [Halorhodospira halochloris]MCG5548736.1 PAS domain-containing protein [Halorhodospira halochloris]